MTDKISSRSIYMKVWDRAGIELSPPESPVRLGSVPDTLRTALCGPVIKHLLSPFPLVFNDNIYYEGNIYKMPDVDVVSLLKCKKRKGRSHGKRINRDVRDKRHTHTNTDR